MNPIYFLVFVVSVALLPFFVSLRAKLLYKKFGHSPRLLDIYKILTIVFAVNTIAPLKAAGFFIRPIMFKKKFSIPYKVSLMVLGLENMFDIIVQLAAALISAYSISFTEGLTITKQLIAAGISFFVVLILFFEKRIIYIIDFFFRVGKKLVSKKLLAKLDKKFSFKKEQFFEIIEQLQHKKGRVLFILGFFMLSLFIVVYSPLTYYVFYLGYNIQITFMQVFVVYWLSFVLGRISGVPGGLGVKEGAIIFVLKYFNVPIGVAVSSTIVLRLLNTLVYVVLGVISSSTYGISFLKLVKERSFKKKPKA